MDDNNSKESKIPLKVRYLGACVLAASTGGDMTRAIDQADKGADLYEQTWANRLRRLEKQRVSSAVKRAIRKKWSWGIQYITGERRRDRAEPKFNEYCKWAEFTGAMMLRCGVEDPKTRKQLPIARGLNDWRKEGFVDDELDYLKEDFQRFKREIALRVNSDRNPP